MAPKGRSAASSTPSAAAESEASEPPAPAREIAAAAAERRKMATSKEAGGSRGPSSSGRQQGGVAGEKAPSLRGEASSSPGGSAVGMASSLRRQGTASSSPGGSAAGMASSLRRQGSGAGMAAATAPGEKSPSSSGPHTGTAVQATRAAVEQDRGKRAAEQGVEKPGRQPYGQPGAPGRSSRDRGQPGGSRASARGQGSTPTLKWSNEAKFPQFARACVGRILTTSSEEDFENLEAIDCSLSSIKSSGTCALFAKGYAVTARHCVIDSDPGNGNDGEQASSTSEEEIWVAYFPCFNMKGNPRPRAFKFYVVHELEELDVAILELDGCNNITYMRPISALLQEKLLGKKVQVASFLKLVDLAFQQSGENPPLMMIPPFTSTFAIASPGGRFTFLGDYFCQANGSGAPIFFCEKNICWLVGVHVENFFSNIEEKLKPEYLDVPDDLQERTLKCQLLYPWIVDKLQCSRELGVFAPIRHVISKTGFSIF